MEVNSARAKWHKIFAARPSADELAEASRGIGREEDLMRRAVIRELQAIGAAELVRRGAASPDEDLVYALRKAARAFAFLRKPLEVLEAMLESRS